MHSADYYRFYFGFERRRQRIEKKIYVISSDIMVETPMIIETIQDTISRINTLAHKFNLSIETSIIRPSISKSFWVRLDVATLALFKLLDCAQID